MIETFSVSEINHLIKDVISAGFPQSLWISGEIQGYDRNKDKKHLFFELVEKDPVSHEVLAKAGLVIWAGTRPKIEALLKKSENAFALKDDIEVRFLCKVDFYPPHGALRLVVESIDPVYTLGKIAQDRQRLIAELTKSGVLAKNKTLALPAVPLRIGLITAYDSAAYNDFIHELKSSGFGFEVRLVRAIMQGKNCDVSVCQGLKALNAREDLDAIVITRGGGSIAELSCFDSKSMALAIAESRYPVVSGIGHEINTSIVDLAAHTYAKTPTATAQLLVERVRVFLDTMIEGYSRLVRAVEMRTQAGDDDLKDKAFRLQRMTHELLKDRRELITRLSVGLRHCPQALIHKRKAVLRPAAMRLQSCTGEFLKDHDRLVRSLCTRLPLVVRQTASNGARRVAEKKDRLAQTIHLRFDRAQIKIGNLEKIVDFASPKKILKRGFSITRTAEGRLVRTAADVRKGSGLRTETTAGQIISTVNDTVNEEA